MIRVNEARRIDKQNGKLKEGQVYRVHANGQECLAVLRGCQDGNEAWIRMDDYTRGPDKLNLEEFKSYEFEFEKVGFTGRLCWACNASEMGYQVASRIAVISFLMGSVGLLLGLVGLVNWHWVGSVLYRVIHCL
jgi:hypothetical protein